MSNHYAVVACRFIATDPEGEPKLDICIAGPQEVAENYRHWIKDRIGVGDLPEPEPGQPLTIKLPSADLSPFLTIIPERWPGLQWAPFQGAIPPGDPRTIPTMPKVTRMAHPVMLLEIAGADSILIGGPKKDAERCIKTYAARHAQAFGFFPDRKPGQIAHMTCNGFDAAAEMCRELADEFPTIGWMRLPEYEALQQPKPKRKRR